MDKVRFVCTDGEVVVNYDEFMDLFGLVRGLRAVFSDQPIVIDLKEHFVEPTTCAEVKATFAYARAILESGQYDPADVAPKLVEYLGFESPIRLLGDGIEKYADPIVTGYSLARNRQYLNYYFNAAPNRKIRNYVPTFIVLAQRKCVDMYDALVPYIAKRFDEILMRNLTFTKDVDAIKCLCSLGFTWHPFDYELEFFGSRSEALFRYYLERSEEISGTMIVIMVGTHPNLVETVLDKYPDELISVFTAVLTNTTEYDVTKLHSRFEHRVNEFYAEAIKQYAIPVLEYLDRRFPDPERKKDSMYMHLAIETDVPMIATHLLQNGYVIHQDDVNAAIYHESPIGSTIVALGLAPPKHEIIDYLVHLDQPLRTWGLYKNLYCNLGLIDDADIEEICQRSGIYEALRKHILRAIGNVQINIFEVSDGGEIHPRSDTDTDTSDDDDQNSLDQLLPKLS